MFRKQLFKYTKSFIPKISDTEMIALRSGTTSIDREIFEGRVQPKSFPQKKPDVFDKHKITKLIKDYPDQFILTGHYFGFYGKDVKKYYPGLCDEKVFPIMIKDKFSDINTYAELNQLRCILNEEENNNE